jgi:repressor LexA
MLESTMPKPLTDLERRVLEYLVEYLRTNTYQPSVREIGREFSIKSTKTVSELLQSLAVKGWIERDPSRSRGVRLIGVEMRAATVSVPLFEKAHAARPVNHYEIDRKLVGGNGAFLVPMSGSHLVEDGIRHGDLLLVEPAEPAELEPGDIVIAGPDALARRCVRGQTAAVLEPVRPGDAPLPLAPSQHTPAAVVHGRVTGVIRRLRPETQHGVLAASAVEV